MSETVDIILKIILALLALVGGNALIGKAVFRIKKKERNTYVAGSSGEIIGRDKVTVNNFTFSKIGDPKELLNKSSAFSQVSSGPNDMDLVSGSLNYLFVADNSFALESDRIEKIIIFFQNVFDKNSNSRTSQSLMRGAFFALLSEGNGNLEWEEHCASSLREFFHEWKGSAGAISAAFNKIKTPTSKNFPNMTNSKELYDRKHLYYEYFSAKCHHKNDNAVRALRSIYSDQKLKQDNPALFKKTVAKFLTEMDNFVKLAEI